MAAPPSLSPRQARALALLAQGWTFGEIGVRLRIPSRIVLLYLVRLQRCHGARTPGALIQILLQARRLPMEWARAQTRRQRLRKPFPATPPAVPAGPPAVEPGGDGPA